MALKTGYVDESSEKSKPFPEDSKSTENDESSEQVVGGPKNEKIEEVTPQSLSNEEMAKMMLEMQSKLDALTAKEKSKPLEDNDVADIMSDYLEDPAVFFCFSSTWTTLGDKRKGKIVEPPIGPIKFKKFYRRHNKTARGTEVISISQFITRSKSEAEWLRSHTLYQIKFFEDIREVKSADVTLAEKMVEQQGVVGKMNDHAVIQRCQSENIPITNNIDELRRSLIKTLADRSLKRDQERSSEILKRNSDKPEDRKGPEPLNQSDKKAREAAENETVYS